MLTIPCVIGNRQISHAMLDLGASISVMPYYVCEELKLNDLQKTSVSIQLAYSSCIKPLGIVKDVLIQVGDLIFPAHFYILYLNEPSNSSTVLLGRPFLKTYRTKIDVDKGFLSVEFDGEIVSFKENNLFVV